MSKANINYLEFLSLFLLHISSFCFKCLRVGVLSSLVVMNTHY